MTKIRKLANVGLGIDVNEFVDVEKEEQQRRLEIFAGYPNSDFSGGYYIEDWSGTYGFDVFDTDQEAWIQKVTPSVDIAPFSIMKGEFDKKAIIDKLENLGYELRNYKSTYYYSINEDYRMGDIDATKTPLPAHIFLNRIMLTDKEIIATPADDILFSLIDMHAGEDQSIKDYPGYSRVIETLGDILGAGIIPFSIVDSKKIEPNWKIFHNYDLVGIGYQYKKDEQKVVIVLHYPDKSAVNDIEEIQRCMSDYKVPGYRDKLLSDLFVIGEPKAIINESDSLLKVELVYKVGTPKSLWTILVQPQDLGFLVNE